MESTRVVFLGGRSLGYRVLKWFLKDKRFEVVAVSLIPEELDAQSCENIRNLIKENSINNIQIDELNNYSFDLVLSVNYHKIISEHLLILAPLGYWNIHHSYNLRLRGRNITTHAILNSYKEKVYYHGTTLHKIVPQLDSGPIVASAAIQIEDTDTAYTLFNKLDEIAYKLVTEWIPRIVFENVFLYNPPNEGIRYFKNNELPSKEIPSNVKNREFYDYVRAFDFEGYTPAYIKLKNRKVELVLFERSQYTQPIELFGYRFYTNTTL